MSASGELVPSEVLAAEGPVAVPTLVLALHSPRIALRLKHAGGEVLATLKLFKGSVAPIRVDVVDQAGLPEDLTGVTRATLRISDDQGGAVLSRDTVALNLTLNGSGFDVSLSQAEADALALGDFLGQMNLEFSTPAGWIPTQEFRASIRPVSSPVLPPVLPP